MSGANSNPAVALTSLVNVIQAQNQVLTAILNALNAGDATQVSILASLNTIHTAIVALAPGALTGSGPQTTQSITANGQTIAVGTNGSVVLTTTTGANMTGMILAAVSLPGYEFTILNTTIYTLTFTASVAGSPTQAAGVAQKYTWDGTNLNWRQLA